jgi:hypothetical protein
MRTHKLGGSQPIPSAEWVTMKLCFPAHAPENYKFVDRSLLMLTQLFRIVSLATMLAVCVGCPRNASNTVTVILDGDPALTTQVAEHLAFSLLDDANWSHISWSQWPWADTRLTLAPISDPESLRRRVLFGSVTRVEDRTVYVKVDRIRGTILVLHARFWKVVMQTFGLDDGLPP